MRFSFWYHRKEEAGWLKLLFLVTATFSFVTELGGTRGGGLVVYDNSNDFGAESMSSSNSNPSSTGADGASSEKSSMHRCAYCGNSFDRQSTPVMPFCSKRCQQIDLGNWLNEAYTFPSDGNEEELWDQSEQEEG